VLVCTNQVGALALMAGSEKVVALDGGQLVRAVANGLGDRQVLQLPAPFPANDFGDATLDPGRPLSDTGLAWWASRAVWDDLPQPNGTVERHYNITEFPFFSFLLGDLHPHVQSLPWTILAVALALELLTRRRAPGFRSVADFTRLVVTAIVLGGLYAINSWDLPTYLLLYLGALALLYARFAGSVRTFFWAHFVQQAGATILLSYLVYIPFHMTFVAPTAGFPLGRSAARTGLVAFGIMFGLFFVPLLAYVLSQASRIGQPTTERLATLPPLGPIVLGLFVAFLLAGFVVGWPLFGLLPLALWAIYSALRQREQPATAFALLLFALAALVVWGVDVVYLRDIYGTRMNTIFKFYYQVWLLWGTLAAYALWYLSRRIRWQSALWLVPTALLLIGSLIYPLRAPGDAPALTLDGLAYLRRDHPDEAAAGDWIMRNTAPAAVVLQAPGKPYRSETARIASVTGRPTVIGWTQHEALWHGGQPELREAVATREQDVTLLYTTTDPALAQSLLARYEVDYVVVGPNEQALVTDANAPAEALAKFGSWMPVAFQEGAFTVYRQP
jgi:YYY domain-containing protein